MSNPLLRRPEITTAPEQNRYENLGFRENPFPAEPALVVNSEDPRLNGDIYCPELHSTNIAEFRKLMVPSKDHVVRTVAFLMDHATRRGRGIGKSAFLKHQKDAIMKDLGNEASGGSAVLFAVYVVPTPSCRKFWEFCQLLADSMCDQGIISQAIWRLRALSGEIPDTVLEQIGDSESWAKTIGSDAWLREKGVDLVFGVDKAVRNSLISSGMDEELAEKLTVHGSSSVQFRNHFLLQLSDSFWRKSGGEFVFNSLVKLFKAAQFTRGLLLVDEVEKIIYHQNLQERRAFVESLRFHMLDGSENARVRFYGMLLTIHPGIQELLLPHWNAAGLDRLAPLNQSDAQDATLYFPPLDAEMAIPLVKVYMDHFRLNKDDRGKIAPFSEEAVHEALVKAGGVPGRTLSLLHRVVEKAAGTEATTLNRDLVNSIFQASERTAAGEVQEPATLPPARTQLAE